MVRHPSQAVSLRVVIQTYFITWFHHIGVFHFGHEDEEMRREAEKERAGGRGEKEREREIDMREG